jgi:hypothetical protein
MRARQPARSFRISMCVVGDGIGADFQTWTVKAKAQLPFAAR